MPDFTPAPMDYSSAFANVPSPQAAFTQGAQSGFALQQGQLQQQTQQYQFARMKQMQQSAAQVAANPTPENISQLSIAFPEISEQAKRSYDMLQPQQQRADLQHMTMVYSALQNGQPDIAASLLDDRAKALENSGANPQYVKAAQAMSQWAKTHPDTFKASAGVILAGIMGPDKFADAFKGIGEGQTTQEKMPAVVAQAGAEASKAVTDAKLEGDKVTADINAKNAETAERYTKLGLPPPEAQKRINDAQEAAASKEQAAARLESLAQQVEQTAYSTGWTGKGVEALKRVTGTQDGVSTLKAMVAQARNTTAVENLKSSLGGGKFTDTDMKVAMGPVPDQDGDPQALASWMRGMAKLHRLDAARSQAEGEWLSQVGLAGHTGPAPHDLSIMGTSVPKGTTFADFSRQFLQRKAEEIGAQASLAAAQGRGYMKHATPGAAAPGGAPAVASGTDPNAPPAPAVIGRPAAAEASPAAPKTEMDVVRDQLDQLQPLREAAKTRENEIQADLLRATSPSKRQFFTPEIVAEIRRQHQEAVKQRTALDAQIGQLTARSRTASMTAGTAPASAQAIIDKYKVR